MHLGILVVKHLYSRKHLSYTNECEKIIWYDMSKQTPRVVQYMLEIFFLEGEEFDVRFVWFYVENC